MSLDVGATTGGRVQVLFVYVCGENTYSPGIAVLSAILKSMGYSVAFHPASSQDPTLEYQATLARYRPSIVGFSVFTHVWPQTRHLIRITRQISNAYLLAGGPHVTFCPGEVLAETPVDAVCRGEAERTLPRLVESVLTGLPDTTIPGCWFRGHGETIQNPVAPLVRDLSSLPWPDRALFDAFGGNSFLPNGDWQVPVQVSRGCLHKCTYCSNSGQLELYHGHRHFRRFRQPADVLEEIQSLVERYPGRELFFLDELFPMDLEYFSELAGGLPRIGKPPFTVLTRSELVTAQRMAALKEAGCVRVAMGVECGDEAYRREMLGRRMSNEVILRAFRTVRDCGMETFAFVMVGMPFETKAQLDETTALVARIDPDYVGCDMYMPLPGSKLYQRCLAEGLLPPLDPDAVRLDFCNLIRHVNITQSHLESVFRFFTRRFGISVCPDAAPDDPVALRPRGRSVGAIGEGEVSPDQRLHDFLRELQSRFPLSALQTRLDDAWTIRGYWCQDAYVLMELRRDEQIVRLGVTRRGESERYFAATTEFELSLLVDEPASEDVHHEPRAILNTVLDFLDNRPQP